MEPRSDAEIVRHFRHAQAHGLLVAPEALQPERQLVPHLICHDLTVRVLHDIPDARALLAQAYLLKRPSIQQDPPRPLPVRRKRGFQVPHQRRFATSALSAQGDVFPLFNADAHAGKRLFFRLRVSKRQILDRKMRHVIPSPI